MSGMGYEKLKKVLRRDKSTDYHHYTIPPSTTALLSYFLAFASSEALGPTSAGSEVEEASRHQAGKERHTARPQS